MKKDEIRGSTIIVGSSYTVLPHRSFCTARYYYFVSNNYDHYTNKFYLRDKGMRLVLNRR